MPMLWLIDEDGRLLRPTTRLQACFGTRLPPAAFADFLARNLGWIFLAVDKAICELRFRPGRASDAALAAAADKLRRARGRLHRVAWFRNGWEVEELATASGAIARMMALADGARGNARAGDFLLRPRDRHNLAPTDPLRLLAGAWSSGVRGAGELALLADNLLNGRYIVASTDATTDSLCIVAQGRDFNLMGRDWLSRVPRLRIADWPDVAYGRWVEQSYRRAWHGAEPLIDDLDCIIQWPKLGRRRHRYARLILPCRSPSGSRLILGAMRFDADIDLRAQVH
jgi:hypothetical protein